MSSGIALRDRPKGFAGEQDKLVPPGQTLAWIKRKLAGLDIKILHKTMRIDTGRLGIPVYISLLTPEAVAVTGTPKQMGKGLSPAQSETSALMELVERYSFFSYLSAPPALRASYAQVAGQALDPGLLFLSLHDESTDRSQGLEVLNRLPLDWVWARNLSQDRDELIPLDWFYLINEYNGPAAGNCLEEAINQGLAEVVERHAASVIEAGQLSTPTIEPDSIPAGLAREALAAFEREGIQVRLKDFSLDTGIPTVAALAWDPASLGVSEIVFQAGTTTDPEKSVIRALTEVQQMACDFRLPTTYRPTLPKFSSLEEADYILRSEELRPLAGLPNLARDNLKAEIEAQAAALGRIGLQVYAVNVTHPDLDVPAVYVIVPGAHFRARTRGSSVLFQAAKLASRRPEEAGSRAALELLARIRPQDYSIQFFRGLALELAGRPEEALAHFRRALELDPQPLDRPSVLIHQGVCLKDLGRFEEALEPLAAAAELAPQDWEARHFRGVCLFQLKRFEEAAEAFAQAIEINPGSGIDYANMGSCWRELGRREEAVRLYRMALEFDPGLDFARQNIERLTAD